MPGKYEVAAVEFRGAPCPAQGGGQAKEQTAEQTDVIENRYYRVTLDPMPRGNKGRFLQAA